MGEFFLKYRDTRPILEVTLLDPDDSVHDLTGAVSAHLHIWRDDETKVTKTMEIQDPRTDGKVRYTFLASDWTTDLVVGQHRMEIEVLGPSTARLSFPNWEYDTLTILSDVGQST